MNIKRLQKILRTNSPEQYTVQELMNVHKFTLYEFFRARGDNSCSAWWDENLVRKSSKKPNICKKHIDLIFK